MRILIGFLCYIFLSALRLGSLFERIDKIMMLWNHKLFPGFYTAWLSCNLCNKRKISTLVEKGNLCEPTLETRVTD